MSHKSYIYLGPYCTLSYVPNINRGHAHLSKCHHLFILLWECVYVTSNVFQHVTPCSLAEVSQCYCGIYYLHFQAKKSISQASRVNRFMWDLRPSRGLWRLLSFGMWSVYTHFKIEKQKWWFNHISIVLFQITPCQNITYHFQTNQTSDKVSRSKQQSHSQTSLRTQLSRNCVS
jgi:hypothetical protein